MKATFTKLTALAFLFCNFAAVAVAEQISPAVQSFFKSYCVNCHGPKRQEADFRVDLLKESSTMADAENWQLVVDNLNLGEMPPEDETQPPGKDRELVTDWIETELRRARRALSGQADEVVLRRLNRTEYEYTIEDLFDIRGDFAEGFPADSSAEGFDNNGAALMLSSEQITQYMEAADFILERAIVTSAKPETKRVKVTLREIQAGLDRKTAEREKRRANQKTEETESERKRREAQRKKGNFGSPYFPKHDDDALIVVQYTKPSTRDFFAVRHPGWYRFGVVAYAVRNQGRPIRLEISSGSGRLSEVPTVIDVVHILGDEPREIQFRVYLEKNQRIELRMLDGTNWLPGSRIEESQDVAIAIRSMEMEGPLIEQWPPRGHQLLLGTREIDSVSDDEIEVILSRLARIMFRRPLGDAVIRDYIEFYIAVREQKLVPLDAFKLTAKAMMASPHFLYHVEVGKEPDEYAIANRLSYFLWRSAPDNELLHLAAVARLSDSETLSKQVDRLLADKKSERFLKDFVGQWLGIDRVGEMKPDGKLYPEYDDELERSMVEETESFVREMLHKNLSLRNLIDSDWAMLNSRMAQHYGIADVTGSDFQRVSLNKSETVRGGLLTQASILTITSNGTTTSPVVRGVWLLERLLGITVPTPPPDVPVIEPDIRGANTIQEQLERHRSIAQCASCHRKIDPYGFALENFDVIGGWRENYRVLDPTAKSNRPKLVDGLAVVSSGTIARHGEFADLREFRKLLQKQEGLLLANVADQLATFALGRSTNFTDDDELRQVVARTKANGSGLKTMIHELVMSQLFRRP